MEKRSVFVGMMFMTICGILVMYNLPAYWTSYLPSFSEENNVHLKPLRYATMPTTIKAKATTKQPIEANPVTAKVIEDKDNAIGDNKADDKPGNIMKIPTRPAEELTPNIDPTLTKVGIGCAITSSKLDQKMSFQHSTKAAIKKYFPIFKHMGPSFCRTASSGFSYHFFFAYDSTDKFFSNGTNKNLFLSVLNDTVHELCVPREINVAAHFFTCSHTHKPAWAQNDAMLEAYMHNMDYYYRINDDSLLVTAGWTEVFIEKLKSYDPPNVGVVGPHHKGGNTGILTYDFVHRTHLDVFGFYYPRAFTDWYADNWITNVYKPGRSTKVKSVRLDHTMELGRRYQLQGGGGAVGPVTKDCKHILERYIVSLKDNDGIVPTPTRKIVMSVFGPNLHILYGAIRNAQLAKVFYPEWTFTVYICRSPCLNDSLEVPEIYLTKLRQLGATIIPVNEDFSQYPPTLWPYQTLTDDTTEIVLVRQARNRITEREQFAVKEWLDSDWPVHTIRDLDLHRHRPLVEGLWGMRLTENWRNETKAKFLSAFDALTDKHKVLDEVIYPLVKDTILYHDHTDCKPSNIPVKVLPQEVPTSDGLIGQSFTWNMIRAKPFRVAWKKC